MKHSAPASLTLLFCVSSCLAEPSSTKQTTSTTYKNCTNITLTGTCDALARSCLTMENVSDNAPSNATSEKRGSNTTSSAIEFCHQCLEGFVEPYIKTFDVMEDECMPISNLTYQDFEDAFQPVLREDLEESERLDTLIELAEHISRHNAQIPPPYFYLELNEISAHSDNELSWRNGAVLNVETEKTLPFFRDAGSNRRLASDTLALPAKVNWVNEGAVTDVKNQKNCGACWSIATVGAIEGIAAIDSSYAYLQSLSFQQLLSCDKSNSGCDGGSVSDALAFVQSDSIGGLTTNSQYPFEDANGITTEQCSEAEDHLAVEEWQTALVTATYSPNSAKERINYMKQGVAHQPVAVYIRALCVEFQSYKGGILTSQGDCVCDVNVTCLDHGVLLVGYDDTGETPYWLIKNSWGTGWGENGYVRVAQIASDDEFPWGLFSVLSMGVIPLRAVNTTTEIDEPSAASFVATTWGMASPIFLAGASLLALACV
jgi:cysteine peptidase B